MKAAVLRGKEDFRVEDVDDPKLSPDGVIIRVKAVGVCGTDLPIDRHINNFTALSGKTLDDVPTAG